MKAFADSIDLTDARPRPRLFLRRICVRTPAWASKRRGGGSDPRSHAGGAPPAAPAEAGQQAWTGGWGTAQHASYDPGTSEVTVRIPVRVSAGGSSARIRLTNGFTTEPVTIGHATVGRRDSDASVAKPYQLRFGGRDEVTIAAGEQAVSDSVRLPVPARSDLVVGLYFPGRLTHISQHWMGLQTVYWTPDGSGDHAGDAGGGAFTRTDSTFPFLTGVDVRGGDVGGSVVALGDSITDGAASTANADRRWPDYLAGRLSACSTTAGVLNEGISGNRITAGTDGNPSALDRLERDVLSQPGARTVILFEGVNDLSWGSVTGAQVIDGMKEIARRAHARGLRVIGATVVPYRGWGDWWTEAKEADRQRVNTFVRDSGGVFDGYADFDRAVRDPADPPATPRVRLGRPSAPQRQRDEGVRRRRRPGRPRVARDCPPPACGSPRTCRACGPGTARRSRRPSPTPAAAPIRR
ncbi:GDSL-type esterase/lipase family protein [Streptomyces mirabilis]|nr:GDSL-type esterase/lipase family protein [Streptomyces mirabilis]